MSAAAPVIGLQLWTLRHELAGGAERAAVLARVAARGVEAIEPYGFEARDARALRAEADAVGLAVPSVHASLPEPADVGPVLEAAAVLGAATVVAPMPDALAGLDRDALSSADGVARLAERLSDLAERAGALGLRIGYHNHWWEWALLPGGRPAFDVLWERTDPRVVAEVDLYWARAAGQDPVDVVARLGARAALVHVKDGDGTVEGAGAQVPLGHGAVSIDAALRAGAEGIRVAIVEADDLAPGLDPYVVVEEAVAWLRARRDAAAATPRSP